MESAPLPGLLAPAGTIHAEAGERSTPSAMRLVTFATDLSPLGMGISLLCNKDNNS